MSDRLQVSNFLPYPKTPKTMNRYERFDNQNFSHSNMIQSQKPLEQIAAKWIADNPTQWHYLPKYCLFLLPQQRDENLLAIVPTTFRVALKINATQFIFMEPGESREHGIEDNQQIVITPLSLFSVKS